MFIIVDFCKKSFTSLRKSKASEASTFWLGITMVTLQTIIIKETNLKNS